MFADVLTALGQSRHFGRRPTTSGLPLETDIVRAGRHVSKVPRTGPHCCRPKYWGSEIEHDGAQNSIRNTASGALILKEGPEAVERLDHRGVAQQPVLPTGHWCGDGSSIVCDVLIHARTTKQIAELRGKTGADWER